MSGPNTIVVTQAPTTLTVTETDEVISVPATQVSVIETLPTATDVIDVAVQGPPGPAGSGDKTYVHTQSTPAVTWIVTHNLGKFPAVMVVDSGNAAVVGEVLYNSSNQVTINFTSAFGGQAFFN